MSFEIFLNISFKNQPMGAHQKFERPSPAHRFLFKKKSAHGLGWAWPSPLGALCSTTWMNEKIFLVVKGL